MAISLQHGGPMDDKRKNRRINIERRVGIAVHRRFGFAPRRPQMEGTARSVSMGGMEILTASPLAVGASLSLWLRLDENDEASMLKLQGDVVWSKAGETGVPSRAGIHLSDRPSGEMTSWTEFIAGHLRRYDF